MAKPASFFTFATNTLYDTGVATGEVTKVVPPDLLNGFIPNTGAFPEHWNYLLNLIGQYTDWVFAGDSTAALTAHVVETAATGKANLAALQLGGTAAAIAALTVSENSGASSSAANFTNTGSGFALTGTAAGSSAGIRGINTSTGPGIEGLASGTNNDGVKGTGTGSGRGGFFTGGATGHGLLGAGGATSGDGVRGTTNGSSGRGVYGLGSANAGSSGVMGDAGHADAYGVVGQSDVTPSSSGGAVKGVAQGDGRAIYGLADDGYAGYFSSPGGVKAPLRLVGTAADPSSGDDGAIAYNTTDKDFKVRRNGAFATMHASELGFCGGAFVTGTSPSGSSAGASNLQIILGQITAYQDGFVVVDCSCVLDNTGSATFKIWDVDGAAMIIEHTFTGPDADVHLVCKFAVSAGVTQNFEFRISVTAGTVDWDHSIMEIRGVYA